MKRERRWIARSAFAAAAVVALSFAASDSALARAIAATRSPILGSRVRARACRARRAASETGRSPGGAHARLRRGSRYSLRYRRGPGRDRTGKPTAGAVYGGARRRGGRFRFAGVVGAHCSRAIGVGSSNPPDRFWPSGSFACGSTGIARSHLCALCPYPLGPSRRLRVEGCRRAHGPARWRLLILRSRALALKTLAPFAPGSRPHLSGHSRPRKMNDTGRAVTLRLRV